MKSLNLGLVAIMLSASAAMAAPCATGTTTGPASPGAGKQASKDTSSNVEGGSTQKTSPGAKAESPGTVGAMEKSGTAASTPGKDEKSLPEGKTVQGQGSDDC